MHFALCLVPNNRRSCVTVTAGNFHFQGMSRNSCIKFVSFKMFTANSVLQSKKKEGQYVSRAKFRCHIHLQSQQGVQM
jgi:hypothetical protein